MQYKQNEREEQNSVNLMRYIFIVFSELMEKFKSHQVVSEIEILAFNKRYDDFACLLGEPEDEHVQKQIQSFLPSPALITQCSLIQTQNIAIDSKSNSTKIDINTQDITLLNEMRALFQQNPIENLATLLELYKQYIQYVSLDDHLKDGQVSFVVAEENQSLLHYLDVEHRRETMTAKLAEKVDLYHDNYQLLNKPMYSPHTIAVLDKLYDEIQSTQFDPYITRKQAQQVSEIKNRIDLIIKLSQTSVDTPKTKSGVSNVSRDSSQVPSSANSSVFNVSSKTVSIAFEPSSTSSSPLAFEALTPTTGLTANDMDVSTTPFVTSMSRGAVSTPGSFSSPFLSPLETKGKWGNYVPDSTFDIEKVVRHERYLCLGSSSALSSKSEESNTRQQIADPVVDSPKVVPRKISRCLDSEFYDASSDSNKQSLVPNQSTSSNDGNIRRRQNAQPKKPPANFSASFWLFASVMVSTAVAAIFLLVLASSLTSTVAVVGWGGVGLLAGVGLFFSCRNMPQKLLATNLAFALDAPNKICL